MDFQPPLRAGRLVRRYKRFLADIELEGGRGITAHCPNTGSMRGCAEPGSAVWVSESDNPKRKLPFTWELVAPADGQLACINTGRANGLAREAIEAGRIGALSGYQRVRAEVRYGAERSRIDLLLEGHEAWPAAWVEVKNVTLGEAGVGYFPDAVTTRGQKHLRELATLAGAGQRAVLFFCVSHDGVETVRPADAIDPDYGRLLREAMEAGVEVMAWQLAISPVSMRLVRELPVEV